MTRSFLPGLLIALAVLALGLLVAFTIGRYPVSLAELADVLWSRAALGAVLGIYFSLGVIGIEALAFAGGLLAVAAVYVIGSLLQSRDPILVLVLTGVVV